MSSGWPTSAFAENHVHFLIFYLLHADLDLSGLGALLGEQLLRRQMRNYFSFNFHEPETIGFNPEVTGFTPD